MILAEENYGKPLEPEVCIFTGIYHPRLKIEKSTINTENGKYIQKRTVRNT